MVGIEKEPPKHFRRFEFQDNVFNWIQDANTDKKTPVNETSIVNLCQSLYQTFNKINLIKNMPQNLLVVTLPS